MILRLATAVAALAALAACARSEPAGEPTDPSNLPEPAPIQIPADPVAPAPASGDGPIAAAVRAAMADGGGLSENAKWLLARSDLNGDKTDEALVYLMDPLVCGTGGCPLMVLTSGAAGDWTLKARIGPAQLPVYKLANGADGWAALGVTVGGGGVERSLQSVPHGAEGYPANPTVPPAAEVSSEGAMLLIDQAEGTPVPAG